MIIRGVDLLGQPFEERAAAQNLSFHGCCYASKHHLPKNTWVTLEVPSGESRGEAACVRARVAWIQRPQTLRDLFQIGVELERGRNVWGVTPAPADWSSGKTATTISARTEMAALARQESMESGGNETSLEVYLQMALAHSKTGFAVHAENDDADLHHEGTLLGGLRREFLANPERGIQTPSEMRDHKETKWIEELERSKVDVKGEIASALAAQFENFKEEMRGALTTEWAEKLSHVQVERPRWEAEMRALREEVRASAEASEKRNEERFAEKLREMRREWESAGIAAAQSEPAAAERGEEINELLRRQLSFEIETARAQWSELLESSLDSAARRLNDRLSGGSQEIVQRTEQELATKIAELQKESGLAAETSRAALSELKGALQEEVSTAKAALEGIEQSAGRFSEYSRQLEAASQDSLNELRQKLESSVARQRGEFDRHATEMEKTFGERAAQMLGQMSRDSVAQGVEQIGRAVAAGLASAARATEELAAREEQAEGILRIHRERLRQVSEQAQRDGSANLASQSATVQKEIEEMRTRALAQWNAELTAERARATEQTQAALAKEAEQKLTEAEAQLGEQAQRAIESAQQQFQNGLGSIAEKVQCELCELETNQIASTREKLAHAAQEQLALAENEFTKAGERAASKLGEVVAEAEAKARQEFSAASEAKTEEGRTRLIAAGENVLAGIQGHAQSSFEHFQEQVAIKADLAAQRATETLTHQLEAVLERFRAQGEARLADWSLKQESISGQALEKHSAQLQEAANSWVEMTLERLDSRSEERVDSAVRATENAIREACVDLFENMAQMMKKQLQGTLEIRPATAGAEMNPQEHRASA